MKTKTNKYAETGGLHEAAQSRHKRNAMTRSRRGALLVGAMVLAVTAGAQAQIRVGPVDPVLGFPLWYEDSTGLRFELCDDLTNCFFDIPDPTQPLSVPDNFPDEAFYWAAEAHIDSGPADTGLKAILVMAREAAFFNGPAAAGEQIVFSRTRFYVDGTQAMIGNTYRITYPYGTRTFVAQPGDAGPGVHGPGLSSTRDIGITTPLEFTEATGEFPTFLIPAGLDRAQLIATPGALLDNTGGLQNTAVQGSPQGTNFFRIEGPFIGDAFPSFQCADPALGGVVDAMGVQVLNDCVETDQFSIMGRVARRHGVQIDKAAYAKVDSDPTSATNNEPLAYVNVWAHTVEGQTLGVRVDGGPQIQMAEGLGGNYFVRLQEGIDFGPLAAGQRKPLEVRVTNVTDLPTITQSAPITDQVTISAATLNTETGMLEIAADSSNRIDAALLEVSFEPSSLQMLSGQWTNGGYGSAQGTYQINNGMGGGAPALRVVVQSLEGGRAVRDVEIIGGLTHAGQVEQLAANAGADQSVQAGAVVDINGADSTGQITSFAWSTLSGLSWTCVNPTCSQINVFTPTSAQLPVDKLIADFTLNVYDAIGNTASDSMQITVTNPVTQVPDECTITAASYRTDKEFWRVAGLSDIPDNQRVFAYVGPTPYDHVSSRLLGETRVDAIGAWEVRTPRRSAVEFNQVPTDTDLVVWMESERGCQAAAGFLVRD